MSNSFAVATVAQRRQKLMAGNLDTDCCLR